MKSLIAAIREQDETAHFLRDRAAVALGLDLPNEADVLARLREVAVGIGKDFVLIFTPEGNPYELLIEN
ncbi:hypothetical protein [Streptomyces sp. G-G2]|uniref:hypothetical protein n=1 Tax=Streptomyces sp. G-G2 TaxID=3046201 RepID=UPI0024B97DF2|nr:hypothetical protein [Streptomyces sp. G-G2]MDJ0382364.1 hypothetical protein [Streptomyces sp. G-G2]